MEKRKHLVGQCGTKPGFPNTPMVKANQQKNEAQLVDLALSTGLPYVCFCLRFVNEYRCLRGFVSLWRIIDRFLNGSDCELSHVPLKCETAKLITS